MTKPSDKSKKTKAVQTEIDAELTTYDIFAPYYDHYMKHVDYDKWTDKFLELYAQHTNNKLKDIHELACGTGNMAERFVKKGYDVTASDRSIEMVKLARQKDHPPKVMQADMTDELPAGAYDMVVCVFDSINYLLETKQISQMLDSVSKGLRKNGLFIFDISTYKNSQDNFDNYINVDETKDHLLIHQAEFDPEHRLQKTKLTIFKRSDNHYMRMDEEHQQRVYSVHELLFLSEKSPLECVGIYSMAYDKNLLKTNSRKLDHQYSRLFFVLKKVKDAEPA
jgi:SAM-dependent methyltransferase